MRWILGFLVGLTGAALFLIGLDHQAVTRGLPVWRAAPALQDETPVEVAAPLTAVARPVPAATGSADAKPTAPNDDSAREPERAASPRAATIEGPATADSTLTTGPDWQPIWRPFKVHSAASGFASYLTELTGETYRVRRLADQDYQVELAYRTEAERRALIERVRTLTGLTLEGRRP